MSTATGTATRRERVRAGTLAEIKATARRLLVIEGPQSVTLRAIAREMGMTAPGLYRYIPSHEDLITALVADLYDELTAWLEEARDAAPAEDVGGRLVVIARAFRRWAVSHPAEFGLLFGSPVPGAHETDDDPKHLAGMRFGAVFVGVFFGLWQQRPFPVAADAELPEQLSRQLRDYREVLAQQLGPPARALPLGAINAFLECWVQLYGVVAMEVLNHLHFCLDDIEPFFEVRIASMAADLGIEAGGPGADGRATTGATRGGRRPRASVPPAARRSAPPR